RLYSAEDLQRIEQILRMKKLLGFSLSEIKVAVDNEEAKQRLRADIRQERSVKRQLKQTQEAAAITAQQVRMVEEKLAQLQVMRKRLTADLNELNTRAAQLEEKLAQPKQGEVTIEEGVQAGV
ncbi:MAG: MerR family transcriptional regulator, partial [Chloroflexota bacterium]|nr:MerR family transcriptional regulator [Chloroflexota bacterium]